jgi:hypothetical protein
LKVPVLEILVGSASLAFAMIISETLAVRLAIAYPETLAPEASFIISGP